MATPKPVFTHQPRKVRPPSPESRAQFRAMQTAAATNPQPKNLFEAKERIAHLEGLLKAKSGTTATPSAATAAPQPSAPLPTRPQPAAPTTEPGAPRPLSEIRTDMLI